MASAKITTADELAALEPGDAVLVTQDGKTIAVHVQRASVAGTGAGGSRRTVTVGYGPGRWNREITLDAIRDGFVSIERG